MTVRSTLAAGLFLTVVSPLAAHATPPQPAAGFYRAGTYIVSAKPTDVCATFGQAAGAINYGVFNYPGPNSTGAALSFADPQNGKVFTNYFSKTPAAGSATWAGKIQAGNEPSGPYLTIPFTATITYLDQLSFSAVEKATITVGANKCSIVENIVFMMTGS